MTLGLVAVVAGCGRENVQTTATLGVGGRIGDIVVRNAAFLFDRPIARDTVYQPGDDAALQLTILTAGYQGPLTSATLPGTDAVRIVLVGLRYPVVFDFERAGELRLDLPVENPRTLRSPPGAPSP